MKKLQGGNEFSMTYGSLHLWHLLLWEVYLLFGVVLSDLEKKKGFKDNLNQTGRKCS